MGTLRKVLNIVTTLHSAGAISFVEQGPLKVSWAHVGVPHSTGYDSAVILHLAATAGRLSQSSHGNMRRATPFLGSDVTLRRCVQLPPGLLDATPSRRCIEHACELLSRWPEAHIQARLLLRHVHPARFAVADLEGAPGNQTSMCGSSLKQLGVLWTTTECPISLVENIVHEMAHQKLAILGVDIHHATRLVKNPAALCLSPVILDRLRPISAVLHAQYSFLHVAELDIRMLQQATIGAEQARIASKLSLNIRRVALGQATLRLHCKTDRAGRTFLNVLSQWADSISQRGHALLRLADFRIGRRCEYPIQ